MTKYLITGGSGFIGTHIVDYLVKGGSDVLNIDTNSPKISEHIKFWKKLDICDKNLIKTVEEFSPEYVIHLGARTDLRGLTLADYTANIEGVENLLLSLEKVDGLKRVIFASSMYVCEPGYKPLNFEDYCPHTVYGESKVLTEKIIKSKTTKYSWSIIRPTSIWGPYFGEPYDLFFKIVLGGKYFHLGDRACKKTYGYVNNAVHQIFAILKASDNQVNHRTFYIGDYEPYDITSWANEIADLERIKIPKLPFVIFKVAGLLGDVLNKVGYKFPMTSFRLKNMTTDNIHDLSPIRDLVPNLPVSRIDGTEATINWIKSNG